MPAGELPTSVLELRARHSIPNDGTPRPKSTVGLVLDHVKVVMVVPGGPVDRLPERADGLRIEHLDTVLAIDPGFRSCCKLAVVDPTGSPQELRVRTIHPHPPQKRREEAKKAIKHLVEAHQVDAAPSLLITTAAA